MSHSYDFIAAMKLATCYLALLAAWASPLRAETYPEVEKLVRNYFAANEAQDWKTVVAMYQPESLEVIRTATLLDAQIPKSTAEVNDGNREMVSLMLQTLAVKTPEEHGRYRSRPSMSACSRKVRREASPPG
jgi:hypothetical protein